jgi:osmotically-inducible protein OsmY
VDVVNGEITLTGSVSDRRIKRLIEATVAECSGDAPIDNRLTHSAK